MLREGTESTASKIIEEARRVNPDVLVLGSGRQLNLEDVGSTAFEAALQAPSSVLLVK